MRQSYSAGCVFWYRQVYLTATPRKGKWGTGALDAISPNLRKELSGLRGFSATQLRDMRLFYEVWQLLDSNSSAVADELIDNSTTAIIESYNYKIDIYHSIQIPDLKSFPVDDFFRVPSSHQIDL